MSKSTIQKLTISVFVVYGVLLAAGISSSGYDAAVSEIEDVRNDVYDIDYRLRDLER